MEQKDVTARDEGQYWSTLHPLRRKEAATVAPLRG